MNSAGVLGTFASVGRLHIVAIAAMGLLTFGWLFSGEYLWGLAGVCALDWFVVNLLNRVVDLEEDAANRIVGTGFVDRHRRGLVWLGFGLLVGSLVGVHVWRPELTPLRVGFHVLGLTYNWPLLPGGKRIKQLFFFKNTASATGFMLTVFGFPLAALWAGRVGWVEGVGWETVGVAAAFFFPFELSYEVLYDLRDVEGDRLAEVRSYPVVLGEAGAFRIASWLMWGSVVVLGVGYGCGWAPWRLAVMGAAPLVQWWLARGFVRRGLTARDCIGLTWLGAGLLGAYHVWVWLELPGVA